ncbi:hypothetical protein GW17_00016237 [Ensete ventricosum]|nr:hypothetical protein GW17_00016237 [Ensete ventricosum]RZS01629.1 hypothetical protein BHM03_00031532 [Ensete ventricosum]
MGPVPVPTICRYTGMDRNDEAWTISSCSFTLVYKAKMAKNFSEAGQSVMGAYPNAQSQWPAGYGQKAPVWPTTTQPQVQWNPGYASQVSYVSFIWFPKSGALFLVPALLNIMGRAARASL